MGKCFIFGERGTAMGLPLFQEKRISIRRSLTGLLPGRLTTVDGQDIICQPKDVSSHGLGITSQTILPVGAVLILKLKNKNVMLEVTWSQPGFGKRDIFRYGLITKDHSLDLESSFIETGCLR